MWGRTTGHPLPVWPFLHAEESHSQWLPAGLQCFGHSGLQEDQLISFHNNLLQLQLQLCLHELDLFDPSIWEAEQTKSCPPTPAAAAPVTLQLLLPSFWVWSFCMSLHRLLVSEISRLHSARKNADWFRMTSASWKLGLPPRWDTDAIVYWCLQEECKKINPVLLRTEQNKTQ